MVYGKPTNIGRILLEQSKDNSEGSIIDFFGEGRLEYEWILCASSQGNLDHN